MCLSLLRCEKISCWRSKTTAAGAAHSLDDQNELQLLASDVHALLIVKTEEVGFHREAQRLHSRGGGFPDESNLALTGDMLGGNVALSVGHTYLVKGTGPVVMHIGFVAADGAGHQSGHFQLSTRAMPIRARDEALVGDVGSCA